MLILDLQWVLFAVLVVVLLTVAALVLALHTRSRSVPVASATLRDPVLVSLLDSLPLGVLVLRDMTAIYANPAARSMLHLPDGIPVDLPAADWVDLLIDDVAALRGTADVGMRPSERLGIGMRPSERLGIGMPWRSRTVTFASDRTVRWWVNASGDHIVVASMDVTGEDRVQRAGRALVSDLGHELRTPIATVLTHLEILGFDDVGEDVHRQSLHLARREAQRLSRLVNDMIELGRLETVEALPLRPLDLGDLTEQVVFQMMPGARERDIAFQGITAAGLPLVLGNADRLRQVLLNLLDNALKYSPPGAQVTVSLERVPDGLECSVCDTGPGIPPEHLPYVMHRFYRAAPETVEGSGLGLSLVQEVLRQHGSDLALVSPVAEGRGTCARFVLPVASDHQGSRA